MRANLRLALLVIAGVCLVPFAASAQSLEEEQASASGSSSGASTLSSGSGTARTVDSGHQLGDEQAALEEQEPTPVSDDGITSLPDATDRDYFSFGVFGRGVVVPGFLIHAFVDYQGANPVNGAIGGFFAWRKNGLNVIAEVGYVGLGGNGFYHGLSAQDTEMEFVQSQLGVVFGSFVFQWSVPIAPWFSLDIGIGLALGGVTGNLYRQEAYPDPSVQYGYQPCQGVGTPNGAYCEGPTEHVGTSGRLDDSRTRGGTYQITNNGMPGTGPNPFYFGDGGVPPIFGWLELPRITARFQPIRQIQGRIDLGYQLYGFMFGASLGYQF
jgi:hypothetical protein